jgi:tripartite-type tricarboxylate transporter receptor subunit TctC
MPGAGSLKAVLFLKDAAPKDGTYMTAFNGGVLVESVASGETARANFSEDFAFIGNINRAFRICFTKKESGITSWDEFVKRKKVIFGATGPRSSSYNNAAMLKNLFDLPMQIITAYPGTSQMYLAIERGEVDGGCVSWSSLQKKDWIEKDKVDIVVKLAKGGQKGLSETVPFIRDVAKTDEKQELLNVLLAPAELGRPIIMSRDAPADRVAFIRKSFAATMKDPMFLADAKKQKLDVDWTSGEEAQEVITKLYKASPAVVAKAKAALD